MLKERFARNIDKVSDKLFRNPHPAAFQLALERLPSDGSVVQDAWLSNAIRFSDHPDKIQWYIEHTDKVSVHDLTACSHPWAIERVRAELPKVCLHHLADNPSTEATQMLCEEFERRKQHRNPPVTDMDEYLLWQHLSSNSNEVAIHYLLQHPDKIDWTELSTNSHPAAVAMLKANPGKINWLGLNSNENPEVIQMLRDNPDKIQWAVLSSNSSDAAVELLLENKDKIDLRMLFYNTNPRTSTVLDEIPDDKMNWYAVWEHRGIFIEDKEVVLL